MQIIQAKPWWIIKCATDEAAKEYHIYRVIGEILSEDDSYENSFENRKITEEEIKNNSKRASKYGVVVYYSDNDELANGYVYYHEKEVREFSKSDKRWAEMTDPSYWEKELGIQ